MLCLCTGSEVIDAATPLRFTQLLFPKQTGERTVGEFDGVLLLEDLLDAHGVAFATAIDLRQQFDHFLLLFGSRCRGLGFRFTQYPPNGVT